MTDDLFAMAKTQVESDEVTRLRRANVLLEQALTEAEWFRRLVVDTFGEQWLRERVRWLPRLSHPVAPVVPITVAQASYDLGITERTVRNAVKAGRLTLTEAGIAAYRRRPTRVTMP